MRILLLLLSALATRVEKLFKVDIDQALSEITEPEWDEYADMPEDEAVEALRCRCRRRCGYMNRNVMAYIKKRNAIYARRRAK